jgi:hypothetical protein
LREEAILFMRGAEARNVGIPMKLYFFRTLLSGHPAGAGQARRAAGVLIPR